MLHSTLSALNHPSGYFELIVARDTFHTTVRSALEKEGWTITHDPYSIRVGGVEMYIDLGAEKLIAAQKQDRKIAVEVKSFLGTSRISEFYVALGQFLTYRLGLQQQEQERTLYLAIPLETYETFFLLEFVKGAIQTYQVNLIVYRPETEEIERWQ